ncbi:MAG: manganese catalase family protein [Clostridiaceae bacterium]|jgi:spore coat protein JC|nr:manganese catalase family protein [Clostridiaceae bacterium]
MWVYDKKTEYPINIKRPDPRMAKLILTQYGGPNGELAASLRYLSQRYAMPNKESKAILTDVGTEELAHFEMVGTMVTQLVKDVPPQELERMGFGPVYAIHGKGVYPSDSNGVPFTAAYIESMSDPIANLNEDLAAEQKARATYEFLINMADDPDVIDPLRFLREREVVHYQRFGEALRIVQEAMRRKKMYYKPGNVMGLADNMDMYGKKDMSGKINIMPNPMDSNPVSPLNIHNIPGPVMPDIKPDKKK